LYGSNTDKPEVFANLSWNEIGETDPDQYVKPGVFIGVLGTETRPLFANEKKYYKT